MKTILQRVRKASVSVEGELLGQIGEGIMLLVGFGQGDDEAKLQPMAQKIVNLRIFPNEQRRFDRSLLEVKGGLLLIPQFTLFADTGRGRRPEFIGALEPKRASELFTKFVEVCSGLELNALAHGRFGAHMVVSLENDGPVTLAIDS